MHPPSAQPPRLVPDMTSGTEKRVRDRVLQVRLTAEEEAIVQAAAERAGLANGSYARQVLLGAPAPRQVRRPPIERRELARLLGELGRVGANLNQLAKRANQGFSVYHQEILVVLGGLKIVSKEILAALGRSS